jgi:TonB family protein
MKFCHLFLFFAVALLATKGQHVARAQIETLPQKQDNISQGARPKLIKSPLAPYPDEALKKTIEGKVELSIVVDAKGRVLNAKAFSGPPELFQAAIDSAKLWEFEPPTHPPVELRAEVSYGYSKECSGPVSDYGEVTSSEQLRNKNGKVVGMWDGDDYALPPYFTEDRRAGITGAIVLSITLDVEGKVKEIHLVKSLSPHLDEAAVKTVRTWKFKLIDGNPRDVADDFQLHILYRATCHTQF